MGEATRRFPSPARISGRLSQFPVWLVGVLATLVAAVVAEAFTLIFRLAGVPMAAAGVWEQTAQTIPAGAIARSVLIWSVGGILLAVFLHRRSRRSARIFVVITVAFSLLSLAAPALAQDTAVSTRLVLAGTHVVAAAVIVPILAIRLSAPDAR